MRKSEDLGNSVERSVFGKVMLMTYQTPTPAPTPCANTMQDGLREVYVSLKTLTRAYAVGVLPSKCLRSVRFVLKLVRAHLLATCQVGPTRCLREKLPSRLSKSGYARLRGCSNMPMRGLICPLSFCPLLPQKTKTKNKQNSAQLFSDPGKKGNPFFGKTIFSGAASKK